MKVLVSGFDGGGFSEVDADAVAHYGLAIEELADSDGVFDGIEGGHYTAEGF